MWAEGLLWGLIATHELVCASIHFLYSYALSARKQVYQLRQHSQCLTAAALAPACFCCCFLFSCRISVMCKSVVKNTGTRSKCGQNVPILDHPFIAIAGGMHGVSQL